MSLRTDRALQGALPLCLGCALLCLGCALLCTAKIVPRAGSLVRQKPPTLYLSLLDIAGGLLPTVTWQVAARVLDDDGCRSAEHLNLHSYELVFVSLLMGSVCTTFPVL